METTSNPVSGKKLKTIISLCRLLKKELKVLSFKGNGYTKVKQLSQNSYFPLLKGENLLSKWNHSKKNEFAPIVCKLFPFKMSFFRREFKSGSLFKRDLVCKKKKKKKKKKKANRKYQKLPPFSKVAEIQPSVSGPLKHKSNLPSSPMALLYTRADRQGNGMKSYSLGMQDRVGLRWEIRCYYYSLPAATNCY